MAVDGHARHWGLVFLHPRRENKADAIRLAHGCAHTGSAYFAHAGIGTFAAAFEAGDGYRTFLRVQGN